MSDRNERTGATLIADGPAVGDAGAYRQWWWVVRDGQPTHWLETISRTDGEDVWEEHAEDAPDAADDVLIL